MTFTYFRAWIAERRVDLEYELDALEALETPRSSLLISSAEKIKDRVVAMAAGYTDPTSIQSRLESVIKDALVTAFPAGIAEHDPTTELNSSKQFLNEALVLLGMSLKTDPSQAVRALLKAPIDGLGLALEALVPIINQSKSILLSLKGLEVGQGQPLRATDTRLTSVDLGLTQAIDGIERIMINLAGSQAINDQLSLQVQSFLTSALDSLAQHTTVAETLSQTTKTLIEERIPELERWHEVVKGHTLNLQNFRSNFEQSVTGLSSDRVEMSAVLSQVMALQEDIALAKARFPDVSSFRSSWIDTLLSAMALTKEARTTATQGIFETDAALAQDYAALVTAMSLVPTTDLTGFSFYARSVQGLLLNTLKTDEIQAQYDSSVERMLTILDLISSRRDALATVLANYPLSPSPLLEKLLAIVEDAKMGTATTALKSGDISTFMQLSVGALNPVDYISKETQTFLATDERLRPLTEKDLADSMSEVLTFERGDVSAAQGFEESRTKAIAALKNDLLRLDRLESILDRAEAQKAQL